MMTIAVERCCETCRRCVEPHIGEYHCIKHDCPVPIPERGVCKDYIYDEIPRTK